MIGQVKEFRAELYPDSFRHRKLLEQREVQAMEPRSAEIARASSQRAVIGLTNGCSHRRVGVRGWIEPLIDIVRPLVWILARNFVCIAAKT